MNMADDSSILICDEYRRTGFHFYLVEMVKKEVGISAQYMNVSARSFNYRSRYPSKTMIMQ